MKKLYILFLLFSFSSMCIGQTYLWEDFSSGVWPPAGWTVNGIPAQWGIGNSNNAGGAVPEAKFTYINQTTITRLISPMMDLTGKTSVKLSFKHFYDYYGNPAPKLGVATRSHNGAWSTIWEITPTANVGPQQKDFVITNGDVGQSEFQICFYLNGNMYNLDYWYLDNVLLFDPLTKDAGLFSLAATSSYFADPVEVKGMIMNVGTTTIDNAEIHWKLDNGPDHTSTFTALGLATQQTYDFTCTDLMGAAIGTHELAVWIKYINGSADDNQNNDTLRKQVYRVCHVVPRKPLYEEFTSSTCGPCAQFNTGFVPWCLSHDSLITLVKYQMNWPGAGDPYYTAEGGVRRGYYGVGFVPDLYVNGEEIATDMTAVQTAYDLAIQKIGMMQIAATHTFTGHVINVSATVLPFTNFTNCRIYIVVMEKVTHNNASTNGETSFHHVMMKMVPDAEGTSVNFTDRVPFTVTDTVDLSGTHVEEWTDLIVGVFVQDYPSREVYQSGYSVENGVLGTESRLSDIKMNGTSLSGFNSDTLAYNVSVPSGTVTVPDIIGIPIDPKETVIVVPALEIPGTTTIDVFGENLVSHTLYTINMDFPIGQNEKQYETVRLYPNPSTGKINIAGVSGIQHITVFDNMGRVVLEFGKIRNNAIDCSSLSNGIYLMRIESAEGLRSGRLNIMK